MKSGKNARETQSAHCARSRRRAEEMKISLGARKFLIGTGPDLFSTQIICVCACKFLIAKLVVPPGVVSAAVPQVY